MIFRKLETEPGPSVRMAGLAKSLGARLEGAGRPVSPPVLVALAPAEGREGQRADGEDAPGRLGVKSARLARMGQRDRGDRQSSDHRQLAEGHGHAVEEVGEGEGHWCVPGWWCSAASRSVKL